MAGVGAGQQRDDLLLRRRVDAQGCRRRLQIARQAVGSKALLKRRDLRQRDRRDIDTLGEKLLAVGCQLGGQLIQNRIKLAFETGECIDLELLRGVVGGQ